MSRAVSTIARIALPIIGGALGGPLGAAAGGAIAGGLGGGGVRGAVLGGITGYAGAAAGGSILGSAAHTLPAGVSGPVTSGSGILGAVTGGGTRALANTVSQVASDPSRLLLGLGNQFMTGENADAARQSADAQSAGIDRGIAANTEANRPYTELGANAAQQIQTIQADPGGYVQNNPFYKSLADDAQRRLFANQAAKGKVGSGGTANALQEQLLNLGNGLVQGQVNTLQNQVNTGSAAAANVGGTNANLYAQQGDVQGAGIQGQNNAYQGGYQNQINTLLALKGLNKAPIVAPNLNL